MCGRLLRLWNASYGYGGRVAGRDEENWAVDVGRVIWLQYKASIFRILVSYSFLNVLNALQGTFLK